VGRSCRPRKMIYGADRVFVLPEKMGINPKQECLAMFGPHGWTLTYDFSRNQLQVAIYKHKLDDAGKQGFLFAELAWVRVK
jgi:hypothetical protein